MIRPVSQLYLNLKYGPPTCNIRKKKVTRINNVNIQWVGRFRFGCKKIPAASGIKSRRNGASFHMGGLRDKAIQKVTVFTL